ncbi:MAG: diguanylate cyclase [Nostoc indistinguendum CM1-VF10]|nr:diguanylate cyclase [Nostoc indistinguendum CM1-VF10]
MKLDEIVEGWNDCQANFLAFLFYATSYKIGISVKKFLTGSGIVAFEPLHVLIIRLPCRLAYNLLFQKIKQIIYPKSVNLGAYRLLLVNLCKLLLVLMTYQPNFCSLTVLKATKQVVGMFVALVGCAVMVGWLTDIQTLKSILPDWVTMKPNAALGFVLAGLALIFFPSTGQVKYRVTQRLAIAITFLGLLTMSEYLFGWNLGIDQLLFIEKPGAIARYCSERMSLLTALNFVLIGCALLLCSEALRQSLASTKACARELEIFMEIVPAAVWIAHDPNCHQVTTNRAAYTLTRRTPDLIMTATPPNGEYPFQFQIQKQGQNILPNELPMQFAVRTGQSIETDLELVFSNSNVRFVTGRSVPLRDDAGNVQGVIGAFWDVTNQKETESALRQSEERFRLAIENIPDTFVIYDAQRRLQYINAFGVKRSGYSLEALIGHTDEEINPPSVTDAYLPILKKTVETRTLQTGECTINLPGCDPFTIVVTYVPLLNELGEIHQILGITHDITERKWAESQLRQNAFSDALTGLANRALFMERLKYALALAKRQEDYLFAVLFLDIDRFKVINDSLGHLIGDQFLVAIASRLKVCVRSVDTPARLGGDEFTILLEGIQDVSEAIMVAERIKQELALPFELSGQEVITTASIGIALSSTVDYDLPEDVLRDADTAMYQAKAQGRARYQLFNQKMYAQALARLHLEIDLRRAVEREEFRVFYQPIVSLTTGFILGFEALLRWQHPERGLLPPASFIPLAEETGLIVSIGNWALHESCRQMQAWRVSQGTNLPEKIYVNLSLKQFSQPDLIEQIEKILYSTGLAPKCLVLEITENVIMENSDQTGANLLKLKRMDIALSIDDFGSGYSSLKNSCINILWYD